MRSRARHLGLTVSNTFLLPSSRIQTYLTLRSKSSLRLTLVGPPGCGKGTQSSRIERDFGVSTIATGHLLRLAATQKTTLGTTIDNELKAGRLISDSLMLGLVKEALLNHPQDKGWLLDGYPRTTEQAQLLDNFLEETGQPLSVVLYINVDKNVIVDRVKDRWVHPASGRTYNLKYNPPKVFGKDDETGEDLVQRDDDKPETVLARLTTYEQKTQPILDYYRDRGLLITVDSPNSDIGYERIRRILGDLTQRMA